MPSDPNESGSDYTTWLSLNNQSQHGRKVNFPRSFKMSLSLDIPGSENDGPSKINLERTVSSIDPGALLLRLAGKPVNKKGDNVRSCFHEHYRFFLLLCRCVTCVCLVFGQIYQVIPVYR